MPDPTLIHQRNTIGERAVSIVQKLRIFDQSKNRRMQTEAPQGGPELCPNLQISSVVINS